MSSKNLLLDSEDVDDPAEEERNDEEGMEVDKNEEEMNSGESYDAVEETEENKEDVHNDDENPEDSANEDDEDSSINVLNDKSNLQEEDTPTKEGSSKLFRFPQGRIKTIMKLDSDVGMVNAEAIFLVNKAVEEFIQCLAVESFHITSSSKKKTIMKEHVMTAIESIDELAFLDGAMED